MGFNNTNFSRLYAGLWLCMYEGKRNKALKLKNCKISFWLCGELMLLEVLQVNWKCAGDQLEIKCFPKSAAVKIL